LSTSCSVYIFFFFSSRRRHTRSYGDWSSDVCSSDLLPATLLGLTWRLWGRLGTWRRFHRVKREFLEAVRARLFRVLFALVPLHPARILAQTAALPNPGGVAL